MEKLFTKSYAEAQIRNLEAMINASMDELDFFVGLLEMMIEAPGVEKTKQELLEDELAELIEHSGAAVSFVTDDNITIAVLTEKEGSPFYPLVGIAKCDPTDEFNQTVGSLIALKRALGMHIDPSQYGEEKVVIKEVAPDCDTCKSLKLDVDQFPCNLCTIMNSGWQEQGDDFDRETEPEVEVEELIEKDCDNCKHEDVDLFQSPCSRCNSNYSLWEDPKEVEVEKGCYNCSFKDLSVLKSPCSVCCDLRGYALWLAEGEAIEPVPEVEPVPEKDCDNCKHIKLTGWEAPCSSCIGSTYPGWEAQEEPTEIEDEDDEHFCSECKHAAVPVLSFPCIDCHRNANWEQPEEAVEEKVVVKVEVEIEKHCMNCLFKDFSGHEEPCNDCDSNYSCWVPEGKPVEKIDDEGTIDNVEAPKVDCNTCKNDHTPVHQAPCRECLQSTSGEPILWEAIEAKEANPYTEVDGFGLCHTCKYDADYKNDVIETCEVCLMGNLSGENWAPIEEQKEKVALTTQVGHGECFYCKDYHTSMENTPCDKCTHIENGKTDSWVSKEVPEEEEAPKVEKVDYTDMKYYGSCSQCKHFLVDEETAPCNDCEHIANGDTDSWRPEVEKPDFSNCSGYGRCSSCEHDLLHQSAAPCNGCEHIDEGDDDAWKPSV